MLVQCYVFLPGIVLVNIDGETFRWSERGLISIIHKRPDGSLVSALYASAMSSQSILARNVANMSSAHEVFCHSIAAPRVSRGGSRVLH